MADGPKKPLKNKPTATNWVEKAGGLPPLIKRTAEHLNAKPDYNESRAIATAVSWAKKMCSTGTSFGGKVKVTAKAQAAACKAVAEWNAKRGKAKLQEAMLDDEWEETLELLEAPLDDLDYSALRDFPLDAVIDEVYPGLEESGLACEVDLGGLTLAEAMTDGQRLAARGKPKPREKRTRAGGNAEFEKKHPRARGGEWTIKQGASGEDVRAIQKKVGMKGDGSFGHRTKQAIMDFQRRHGLQEDGVVGHQTAVALAGNFKAAKTAKVGGLKDSDRAKLRALRDKK